MKFSTHIFNFRLFVEGLKRLRIIGLTSAILAMTTSLLIPITVWIENGSRLIDDVEQVDYYTCIPTVLMVLMAPLFFLVLFSFLFKRKDSDFFHAIPYTRTCVYISFTAAALTFVAGIQLACGLAAGLLWSACPFATYDVGLHVTIILLSVLAAAMLSGFMMLALSVSGTSGSCVLLFFLFSTFVRIVCAMFLLMVETIELIPSAEYWEVSFASPLHFLPITLLWMFITPSDIDVMFSASNIVYSIVASLALFVAAGFLYVRRRSEMAGNPAPGVRTQALFRIMFTLVPALLIPTVWIATGRMEPSLLLVLVVITLLVYFLYELITTKRPRNMLCAVPALGFVLAGCLAMGLGFAAYRAAVLHESVDADEIRSVQFDHYYLRYDDRDGRKVDAEDWLLTEPEILQMIAEQLTYSQGREGLPNRDPGSADTYSRCTVTIRLRNGRTLHRRILLTNQQNAAVHDAHRRLDAYIDLISRTYSSKSIRGIQLDIPGIETKHMGASYSQEEIDALWEIFTKEFQQLSIEKKMAIVALGGTTISGQADSESILVHCINRQNDHYLLNTIRYYITDDLPQTRTAMYNLWSANAQYCLEEEYYAGEYTLRQFCDKVGRALSGYPKDKGYWIFDMTIVPLGRGLEAAEGAIIQGKPILRNESLSFEEAASVMTDLREAALPEEKSQNAVITSDTCAVFITLTYRDSNGGSTAVAELPGLFCLDGEVLARINRYFEKPITLS